MNKSIFHGLLIATPLAALVLFFSLTGKEEVKQEQRLQQASQKLEEQKFDNDFADAWNQQPPGAIEKRAGKVKELEAEVAKATAKRDSLDKEFDDMHADMKHALTDEDDRLKSTPASSVKSAQLK
jgi:septal ring factor EnvC (AmiA/AmiB activator)